MSCWTGRGFWTGMLGGLYEIYGCCLDGFWPLRFFCFCFFFTGVVQAGGACVYI